MKKYIPYEKLSKKMQRQFNAARRNTWGSLKPTTRKPPNSKAYNRKRTQDWKKELPPLRPLFLLSITGCRKMLQFRHIFPELS